MEETYNVLSLIEQRLEDIPEVEQIFMTGDLQKAVSACLRTEAGSMWVQLVPMSERSRATDKIVEDAREGLKISLMQI